MKGGGSAKRVPDRGRVASPRFRRWTRGGIALLMAALGLLWLGHSGPLQDGLPMYRVRAEAGIASRGFAFRPDGRSIASIDDRGRVRLRLVAEGGIERDFDVVGFAKAAAFSPDGHFLAVGRQQPDIVLCDLAKGGQTHALGIPIKSTSDLSFSPDGQKLAVSSYNSGDILLWDIRAGRVDMILKSRSSRVITLAFAPDGRSLASADSTGIVLWHLATGLPRRHLAWPTLGVTSLTHSPDGRLLAAVDPGEHSVRIWDVRTGEQHRRIVGRFFPIQSAAFSSDGRLLATAGGDGFVSLWHAADGREVCCLDGHAQFLRRVAFSPDGRMLAATGNDHDIRLWYLDALSADNAAEKNRWLDPAGPTIARQPEFRQAQRQGTTRVR
jgi:WD40 repeat protein